MSWVDKVIRARHSIKSLHSLPPEDSMPEVSFPKHPNLMLDGDDRLCITKPDGTCIPLTKKIVFVNETWGREAMSRLNMVQYLQSSLASALLCVRKLMHSKSKKTALNDADQQVLTIALAHLRASRGNESHSTTTTGKHYGMSFVDAIDKTFKEAAEAVPATAPR